MINEERVKHMTRMAIFEKENGSDYQPMMNYSKKDYVALHGWGGFFAGTLFFVIIYGLIIVYLAGSVMDTVTTMAIMLIVIIGLLVYAAYIIMHVYNVRKRAAKRYKAGKKLIKELKGKYDQLGEMYATEEAEQVPAVIRDTQKIELPED